MRGWRGLSALLLIATAITGSESQEVFPHRPLQPGSAHTADPRVCVVIRTYWGHAGPTGLLALLQTLQRQSVAE